MAVGEGLERNGKAGRGDGNGIFVGEDNDEPDGEVMEALVEMADPKQTMPTPVLPSPSEILKHRECHIPYQSWCEDLCGGTRARDGS